jgi:hypothetical protein
VVSLPYAEFEYVGEICVVFWKCLAKETKGEGKEPFGKFSLVGARASLKALVKFTQSVVKGVGFPRYEEVSVERPPIKKGRSHKLRGGLAWKMAAD